MRRKAMRRDFLTKGIDSVRIVLSELHMRWSRQHLAENQVDD